MAIDSKQKRASIAGLLFAGIIIPDGTIDAADRQTISGVYSGILAAEPFPVVTPDSRTASAKLDSRIAAAKLDSRIAGAKSTSRITSAKVV